MENLKIQLETKEGVMVLYQLFMAMDLEVYDFQVFECFLKSILLWNIYFVKMLVLHCFISLQRSITFECNFFANLLFQAKYSYKGLAGNRL